MWGRVRFQWEKLCKHSNLRLRAPLLAGRESLFKEDDLERFVLFLGYGRSGSTLLASLLNAHPDIAIAHELDVCWYVERGISRNGLFALLIHRHEWFASKGWKWTGYDYRIPGTHQGSYRRLVVLGDKRARGTAVALGSDLDLVDQLRAMVGVPVCFIHQIRNPFDNITTMARRNDLPLHVAAGRYFELAASVARARERLAPEEFLDTWLEDLVSDPPECVRNCFEFLGVAADEELLTACAQSVFAKPRRTRDSRDWPTKLVDRVHEAMTRFPWLDRYSW